MKATVWRILASAAAMFFLAPGVAWAQKGEEEAPSGDADEACEVVLGEEDLAEWAEIKQNFYRRITPGDGTFVQDFGAMPAAWEEFSARWNSAPAERDLATWLVPVAAERDGGATVLRDGTGVELWRGTTDFAKDESANVTLTGVLIDEDEWALWTAAREEIASRLEVAVPMRGGPYTNGLRFTNAWMETNGVFRLDFAWEEDGDVEVFYRAMHSTSWVETVVWTNDENEVVTNDFTRWRQLDTFKGIPDAWERLAVASVTNGSGSVADTNLVQDFDRVRFYAAAKLGDEDHDGLTDGEEWLWDISSPTADTDNDGLSDYQERKFHKTDPDNPDTDGDGWTDGEEVSVGTDPLDRLDAPRLARGVLVHAVKYACDSSNQWVQLHCSGPRAVDVSGFRVQAAGTNWETMAALPKGTWMEPGHFLLVGGAGVTNADLTAELGLEGTYSEQPTAGVRLIGPEGTTNAPADTMFYGTHIPFNTQGLDTAGWLSETTNLWASATRHLERWNIGQDTDRETDWRHVEDGDILNSEDESDTDGDGLTDAEEYTGANNHGVPTNPLKADGDGDGLLDGYETGAGLNPLSRDSDGNGIEDGEEIHSDSGLSHLQKQEGDGLSVVHSASKGDWRMGESIGMYGNVLVMYSPETDVAGS